MRFLYTGRKVDITDELKKYTEKKFTKLDRFFQQDTEVHVTYSIERGRHSVEATVHHAHMFFRAQDKTGDMYASVDHVVDIIERQIRKNKTRLEKKMKIGAFDREIPAEDIAEEQDFEVVRRKRFAIKPMTAEEAILQMNLLGHEFFAFKNFADGDRYCVVYKRSDGGYGLIESD